MASEPSLGWSIGVLFRAWQQCVASAFEHVPHGGRGYQILEALGEQSPPTQAALGLHLGIDRTVLTYVIDDLVREGLVERQTDEADRRVRRLSLTTQGRECLARLDEVVAASEAGLFAALPEGERAELARLIPRAAASIHAGDEHACTIVQQIVGDSPEARKTPA